MPKNLVVLLCKADWAGSAYAVYEAIKRVNRIECRHITLHPHLYEYQYDILIPIWYPDGQRQAKDFPELYFKAMEVLDRADLIHVWNETVHAFKDLLPVPENKVKSYSFSGTLYRTNHTQINQYLNEAGAKVVVENPTYCFPEEIDSEFIPHAIDTDYLKPIPLEDREPKTIGIYRPKHGNTSAHQDLNYLQSILTHTHPDWRITLDNILPFRERMNQLKRCVLFFEYMDSTMGYWGRSALEACSMGVPTFSYISNKALRMSMGRVGNPPIIHVSRESLSKVLAKYLSMKEAQLVNIAQECREWVVSYFSYETIGELYTAFFEKILNGINNNPSNHKPGI